LDTSAPVFGSTSAVAAALILDREVRPTADDRDEIAARLEPSAELADGRYFAGRRIDAHVRGAEVADERLFVGEDRPLRDERERVGVRAVAHVLAVGRPRIDDVEAAGRRAVEGARLVDGDVDDPAAAIERADEADRLRPRVEEVQRVAAVRVDRHGRGLDRPARSAVPSASS
jgi:hypothetical protein